MPASDYSQIRGFNYQPSYSSHLQYTWTHFDAAIWEREVPWATRFGSNMLRLWLDWSAYLALGDALADRIDTALGILERSGLRAMLVLFNRWVDPIYPAGGVSDNDLRTSGWGFEKFDAYIDLLAARFGADPRVGLWDLCNEPLGPGWNAQDILFREHVWLAHVADRIRRRSRIPVTVGAMTCDFVLQTASLCDVISFHPYPHHIGEMEQLCRDHLDIAARFGKPLICTETCCGSLNDAERGALARDNIETLERHGIGWLAWHLCESRFVTGSRMKTDSNAVRPGEGYMPFVLADGRTRPGHEWLEVMPSRR
jgi:hypothetical protein